MGESSGTSSAPTGRARALWVTVKTSYLWRHKTKVCAVAFGGASYLQANLSSVGKGLPPHVFAYAALGASGVVFVLGFLNTVLPPDES